MEYSIWVPSSDFSNRVNGIVMVKVWIIHHIGRPIDCSGACTYRCDGWEMVERSLIIILMFLKCIMRRAVFAGWRSAVFVGGMIVWFKRSEIVMITSLGSWIELPIVGVDCIELLLIWVDGFWINMRMMQHQLMRVHEMSDTATTNASLYTPDTFRLYTQLWD